MTTDTTPTRIGIIGCGNISDIYFEAGKRFRNLEIVACADLLMERAKEKAEKHGVPKALSVDQLLSDPDVEIVVNLTIPKAHAEVALAALEAGKHVYGEKPLAVSREQGRRMVSLAKQKGLRIGCAPDTFLGGGHQTCRKLIDDGVIGEPVAASAFMLCHGHESWHPDPEFYYDKEGGGPLLDMGPYYLTALVNMIGGIRRVAGAACITFPERTITSQKKYGTKIVVGTPTHIASTLDFHTGAIATLVTSFDVWAHHMPNIEVYGTEGSLLVPDPNGFGGRVLVKRHDEPEWREVSLVYGYTGNARGLGVADMAAAIRSGRAHRASGDLAFHVLDVMLGILESSEQNKHYFPETAVDRPKALPLGLQDGEIDA
ncbi:MAG TPA: Gfo/Idh/MocA family oxidoreductase [Chthonomonas sp.]|uniref:Gfo/Idh/MocA family protein n=1 Tax=Chthonomonas sp. TaxID=2282153 RepID=UPI002B4AC00B|nr:Gfo/Idh/MocA family oxidoreductase [Chthonomonas sp.]HLI48721.1 Gfo/Idh/MocA family oxidoreductase [Chthonomonas sp.]